MPNKAFIPQFTKPEVNENKDRRSNHDKRKSINKNSFLNGG